MNLRLFQELTELNAAFEQVIHGLQRMEKVKLYHSDIIRYARADVESAPVADQVDQSNAAGVT